MTRVSLLFLLVTLELNGPFSRAEASNSGQSMEEKSDSSAHPKGQSDQLLPSNKRQGLGQRTRNLLEASQGKISRPINRVTRYLDSFYGLERVDEDYTGSRLRVNLISVLTESQAPRYDINLNTRFRLPRTEERFQVFLQNLAENLRESDRGDPLENTVQEAVENRGYFAGVRFVLDKRESMQVNFDQGVKLVWPPDPFARINFRYKTQFPGRFQSRFFTELRWFQSDGFSQRSEIDIDRPLSTTWHFRFANRQEWRESEVYFTYAHSLNLYQRLSDWQGLSYSLGLASSAQGGLHVTGYSASAGYRLKVFADWMFLEILPSVRWPRSQNFVDILSLDTKLEVLFGDLS